MAPSPDISWTPDQPLPKPTQIRGSCNVFVCSFTLTHIRISILDLQLHPQILAQCPPKAGAQEMVVGLLTKVAPPFLYSSVLWLGEDHQRTGPS